MYGSKDPMDDKCELSLFSTTALDHQPWWNWSYILDSNDRDAIVFQNPLSEKWVSFSSARMSLIKADKDIFKVEETSWSSRKINSKCFIWVTFSPKEENNSRDGSSSSSMRDSGNNSNNSTSSTSSSSSTPSNEGMKSKFMSVSKNHLDVMTIPDHLTSVWMVEGVLTSPTHATIKAWNGRYLALDTSKTGVELSNRPYNWNVETTLTLQSKGAVCNITSIKDESGRNLSWNSLENPKFSLTPTTTTTTTPPGTGTSKFVLVPDTCWSDRQNVSSLYGALEEVSAALYSQLYLCLKNTTITVN